MRLVKEVIRYYEVDDWCDDFGYHHRKKQGGTVGTERHHQRGRGAPPKPGMCPFDEDASWQYDRDLADVFEYDSDLWADHRKRRGGTQPNRAISRIYIERWNDEDVYPFGRHSWNPRWGDEFEE